MNPKWVGFLVFIWVIGALVGSVSEGTSLLTNETITGPVQGIMSYTEVWSEQDWGTLVHPGTHTDFFEDLFQMLLLDFPVFEGPWAIIRWIVLAPIVGTIVFGLILMFFSIFQKSI